VTKKFKLRLFEGCGIELEYMIVHRETLDVMPVSDEILKSAAGRYTNDYSNNGMGWSNEFVRHVLEVKNNDPLPSLKGLADAFLDQVQQINTLLEPMGGMLMPSGMHPWMNPRKETKLWQHRYRHVYETYDRIFNCRRHGWANLQSMHINLSFAGDREFARLHAAVRLLMPIIPALAASSPIVDGKVTGLQDTRLSYYSRNQRKVPSVMGSVIPEPVFTRAGYRKSILEKMYADIEQYDTDSVLQHEWLNSRGAIPRYERNALEIRVVDAQECPSADIAVAESIMSVLKMLVSEHWGSNDEQRSWKVRELLPIFRKTIRGGDRAVIDNERYLKLFGFPESTARADELWKHLIDESSVHHRISGESLDILRSITAEGTLARRILKSLGSNPSRKRMKALYEKLCRGLTANTPFVE